MKGKRLVGAIVALAIVVSVLAAVIIPASAETPTSTPTPTAKSTIGIGQQLLNRVAEILNISPDTLMNAIKQAGKESVDQALSDGKIAADMATKMKERIDQGVQGFLCMPFMGRGGTFDRPDARMGTKVDWSFSGAAAKALGITEEDLRSEMQKGNSISTIAKNQNKDIATVKAAILADAKAYADKLVADGKMTADQAKTWYDKIESQITSMIDAAPGPKSGFGRNMPHGWRM